MQFLIYSAFKTQNNDKKNRNSKSNHNNLKELADIFRKKMVRFNSHENYSKAKIMTNVLL